MQMNSIHEPTPRPLAHVGDMSPRPLAGAAPPDAPPPAPQDHVEASDTAREVPAGSASLQEFLPAVPVPQVEAPPVPEQAPDAIQAALLEYRQSPVRPDVNLEQAAAGTLMMVEDPPPAPARPLAPWLAQAPAQGSGGVGDCESGFGEKLKFWKWGVWERLQSAIFGGGSVSASPEPVAEDPEVALSAEAFDAYTARAAQDPLLQALVDPGVKVLKKKNLGSGINASSKVKLSNGVEALWKPTQGEDMSKLRDRCEEDHQGRREAATYIVDRWMNHFAGVPPVVYRELGGEKGTLMLWVKDARVATDVETKASRVLMDTKGESFQRMAVLDHVIGNLDRHDGNWMIDNTGQAVPIDHGLCFPLKNGRQGSINFDFDDDVRLEPRALEGLQNLVDHRDEVTTELTRLIDSKAVDAMFVRVEKMLKLGKTSHFWM